MIDDPDNQQQTTNTTLVRVGRDLCATLLEGELDQSIKLLLDHANRIDHSFSDETRQMIIKTLEEADKKKGHRSADTMAG